MHESATLEADYCNMAPVVFLKAPCPCNRERGSVTAGDTAFACGCTDGSVTLWDAATQLKLATLSRAEGPIWAMQCLHPLHAQQGTPDDPALHVVACGDRSGGLQLHRIECRRSETSELGLAAACTALQKQGAAVLCLAALHRTGEERPCACFMARSDASGSHLRGCDGTACSLAVATGCAGALFAHCPCSLRARPICVSLIPTRSRS